jgi:transcriptional regulator with XRE-family HTH domain
VSKTRHQTAAKISATMARRVADLRRSQKLTLDELAERAGMSKSHVWETENGKASNPTVDTAVRLSRALGCSLDFLCGIETSKPDLHPEALRIACEVDVLIRGKQRRKAA